MNIVIPLFPGVTHLDFTGPQQFFSRVPNAQVTVASLGGVPIEADGLTFSSLAHLERLERCDLLCIPGGLGVIEAIEVPEFMEAVGRLAEQSKYITSVCTGSIILAALGLLDGKRATCHWAWKPLLQKFPNVTVLDDRVVRDGNVFTGGGVTAGIDMALTVIAEVVGPEFAQRIQLGMEYAPQPPFQSGRPDTAPAAITTSVDEAFRPLMVNAANKLDSYLSVTT